MALMTEFEAHPLRTLSVGLEEPACSELPYARAVARRFAAQHHELILRPEQMSYELPRLVAFPDEPIAEPTDLAL